MRIVSLVVATTAASALAAETVSSTSTTQSNASRTFHPCDMLESTPIVRREVPLERDASGYYFDRDADWHDDFFDEECTCDAVPRSASAPAATTPAATTSQAAGNTTSAATSPTTSKTQENQAPEGKEHRTLARNATNATESAPAPTMSFTLQELLDGVCWSDKGQRIGKRDWPNGKIISPTNCEDWKKEYCNPMIPASVTLAAMVSEYREHLKTALPTSSTSA